MAGDENLDSMTVIDLRSRLKTAGLSSSGKKSELMARLTEHLAKTAETKKDEVGKEASKQMNKEGAKAVEGKQEETKVNEAIQEAKPDVEMKDEEELKELEVDATPEKRPKIAAGSAICGATPADATLNVMVSGEGKVLTSLTDAGLQHFVAAARSSVGVKAGRYFFEVRVIETRSYTDASKSKGRQSCCCLGFSTAGSSLVLGDGAENVGFDSDGHVVSAGKRSETALYKRFTPYTSIYGVLLNLDQKSANANTVSLFCDGARVSKPQLLPESLRGKTLFPTVSYKGMTLHVNLGPSAIAPLPFRCPMLQEAAVADAVVNEKPNSGKPKVVFPVGLPEEGTFEWLDGFLKQNPQFTELSNRAIMNWGLKSGLYQQQHNWQSCNDRPAMDFGIREIDDYSLLKTIHSLAPTLKRDYVVMEVKDNLLTEGRSSALATFKGDDYQKVAMVVVGEPPKSIKEKAQAQILEDKTKQVASEVRRTKTLEAAERRREKQKKKEAEQKEEEAQQKEGQNDGVEKAVKQPEADQEEAKEDAESIEEAVKKATAAVELTQQEKSVWFPKPAKEDLNKKDLSRSFGSFSLPTKEEGFDTVTFEWNTGEKAKEYLKSWVAGQKLSQRVEELQPGASFKEQLAEWNRQLQEWRKRINDRRGAAAAQKNQAEKKRKVGEDGQAAEADDVEAKAKADDQEDSKAVDVDPYTVENIDDIGTGDPLYANFTWEDWTMLTLRFELHLLVHSFKTDVKDAERPSFHESHLPFYYYTYYKKQLNVKHFGVETNIDLLKLVQDTVDIQAQKVILVPQLSEDTPLESFVRLTEDHRRERLLRIDAGDETAMLKLQRQPSRQQQQQQWVRPPWDAGKGRDDNRNRGAEWGNKVPRDGGYKGGSYRAPTTAIGQPAGKQGAGREDGRQDARSRDQGYRESRPSSGAGYGSYSRDASGYARDSRGAAPTAPRSRSPPQSQLLSPTYSGNEKSYVSSRGSYGSTPPPSSRGGGGGGGSYGGSTYGSSGAYRR